LPAARARRRARAALNRRRRIQTTNPRARVWPSPPLRPAPPHKNKVAHLRPKPSPHMCARACFAFVCARVLLFFAFAKSRAPTLAYTHRRVPNGPALSSYGFSTPTPLTRIPFSTLFASKNDAFTTHTHTHRKRTHTHKKQPQRRARFQNPTHRPAARHRFFVLYPSSTLFLSPPQPHSWILSCV
jgi:hypothetical protein